MPLTLDQLNTATPEAGAALLDGVYEHSPWIARQALAARPFATLAQLKHALACVVRGAGRSAQLALLQAHPQLAGKAMQAGALTAASAHEQDRAGLAHCSPAELALLKRLNHDYQQRFGHPFILAVRGPRGNGLGRQDIIATLQRRLQEHPDDELAECLRQVHRIAELRLNDKFGWHPLLGQRIWDWHEALARHRDPDCEGLSVAYLTQAHRACAQSLSMSMRAAGFDEVFVDAVGNVVARYHASVPGARYLMTGSHYDTVRNAGKYDGRLGIFVPMGCVKTLAAAGQRLPFGIELVAFAEEEGQRFKATFLGSSALVGDFQFAWLEQRDAQRISMRDAMQHAGLSVDQIKGIARRAEQYVGFVEIHIEQGPVLNALDLPLGVVSAINGSVRLQCSIRGVAAHAGTTPMQRRRDAACAGAELVLYAERRAAQDADSVATVGVLQVPQGSVNVVPGCCEFTLDLRAPSDSARDALVHDVCQQLAAICERRALTCTVEETLRINAAPSDRAWQDRWQAGVAALGLPVHCMPSGAGHDAMKIHALLPQAMLFVRGQNGGISHNPLESTTADDMQLAADAFSALLQQLAQEHSDAGPGSATPAAPHDH